MSGNEGVRSSPTRVYHDRSSEVDRLLARQSDCVGRFGPSVVVALRPYSSSPMSTNRLFLGLDLSTQQLKAVLLSQDATIVHEASVHFDRDLPHYGTVNGAIRGPESGEVTSPVEMWLEAVDLLFQRLKTDQVDFGAISAISGAGQVRL